MPLLSLAAGVLPEFAPQVVARAAMSAGYDATGVWVDVTAWNSRLSAEMKSIVADGHLSILDAEVVWLRPGPLQDAQLATLEIARELGAQNLLCVSSDPDHGATAGKLAQLCERASGEIRIALEFGLFTEVKTLGQAAAILRRVDHPMAALLIDPLHLARSGGTPADVLQLPTAWLPYAQFCDAGPLTYDVSDVDAIIREAVDARFQIGEGVLPLRELHSALPANTPLSLELRSKALRDHYPDPAERARTVRSCATRFLFNREVHRAGS